MERGNRIPSCFRYVLLVAVVGAVALASLNQERREVRAEENGPIAATALKYVGTHGGQCWTFMREVVKEATGRTVGFDYRLGFFEAGAIEVTADEARNGDIIQIARDSNTSPWASYSGLHTAIILKNLGGGRFDAVDSNQNWDEMVRLRPNYDPYTSAARNGLQVHIYRIPGGGIGDSGAGAAASVAVHAAPSLGAGDTAVVSANGDCLNLRAEASRSGGRIACLPSGSQVTVLSEAVEAGGFTWVQVSTPSGTGWVAAEYLKVVARAASEAGASAAAVPVEAPAPPPAPEAPAEPVSAGLTEARVDNSPGCLRVRSAAGTGAGILDCLPASTAVGITADARIEKDGYTWVRIQVPGRVDGWVAAEFLVQ